MSSAAKRRIASAATLVACVLLSKAAWAQGPPPGVFSEVPTAIVARASAALEPATMRSRVVQVDTRKITAARRGREVLKLNLFDDAVVEVQIKRTRPTRTGYFVSGIPKGKEWGEVRLVVNGPIVVGTVETPEGKFTIRSGRSGRHVIRQIDPAAEAFECGVRNDPISSVPSLPPRPMNAISSLDRPPAGSFSLPTPQADDMPTEDGSQVRILVVYTPAAQAVQGGAAGMRALIDLYVQSANQSFEDGGINPRLVLAHSAMVNYSAQDLYTDFDRLQSTDDGYLDEVHALRNEHAADLVHLITNAPSHQAQGIAAALIAESLDQHAAAFSISAIAAEHVFVHEIGHNFGMRHDRYASIVRSAAYPYAFGYSNKAAFEPGAPAASRWMTVMSTNYHCRDAGLYCPRLLRFSNPDQTYKGDPLGVASDDPATGVHGPADARLAINNSAPWVGSFRSEACADFTVSPEAEVSPVGGGEVVLSVDAPLGCVWEVSSHSDFLNVTSGARSAGSGFAHIEVDANQSGAERSGTLTVAGETIAIRQLSSSAGVCGRTTVVMQAITEALGLTSAQCGQVTDADLAAIRRLSFHGKGISSLKSGDFESLSGLTDLMLRSNRLTELPEELFAGLSNLTSLTLTDNRLTELPEELFSGLSNLTYLYLSDNHLTELPEELFSGLSGLGTLLLDRNHLAELPEGLFSGASSLVRLYLEDNQLTQLHAGVFAGLSGLEVLYLNDNQLIDLPNGIFAGLSSAEWIYLDDNQLTALPDNVFAGLSKLTRVDVNDNQLAALPVGTFDGLTSLEDLDLSENKLAQLTVGAFAGLASLEVLNLDHNQLTALPVGIFDGLSNLRDFSMQANGLAALPVGIFDAPQNLRKLRLRNNALTELRSGVFAGLSNLQNLDLYANDLTSLPAGIFDGLARLEELDLELNDFFTLPEGLFAGLAGLDKVVLRRNAFSTLPAGLFTGMSDLLLLDLRHNTVTPLPLTLTIETVEGGKVKARVPAGAPFELFLPLSASSGGEVTPSVTIPLGATESASVPVTRVAGTQEAIFVDFGTLPNLPARHLGYALEKDASVPLLAIPSLIPADANLAGLSLSDGTLAPAFDANTMSYTASLPNAVSLIKVAPTTSNSSAALAYFDGNGLAIADEDPGSDALDVSLIEGENTIKIEVSSDDGTTVQTYTITLTRENSQCNRSAEVLSAILALVPDIDACGNLTKAHLQKISRLDLSDQGISSLGSGDFAELTSLEQLDLEDNQLSSLPPGVFSGLTSLEQLFLRDNQLSSLAADTFSDLASLELLHLTRNKLSSLSADVFSGLTSLRQLWMDSNGLNNLPPGLFSGLTSLEQLNLHSNNISSLSVGIFSGLDSIQLIRLSHNSLRSLPDDVFSGLSGLAEIRLPSNRLTHLPDGVFSNLNLLRSLDLSGNAITSLQADTFSDLASLEFLFLDQNDLTELPAGLFSGLGALELLYLEHNSLSSLPAGIFSGLSSLKRLTLHRNTTNPMPMRVSLEKVGDSQFKAVAPAGAAFSFNLGISVNGPGMIEGDAETILIPKGAVESSPLLVTRVAGSDAEVSVDIDQLPVLNPGHEGYVLQKDDSLPREILPLDASKDALLSGLSLGHGTLSPGFDIDISKYEALVANEVSSVTLTATARQTGATVAYLDAGDSAISDAAPATDGHQAALNVGENSITIRVTSEDGSVTRSYALLVTRDGATDVCSRTDEIRDAITTALSNVSKCFEVTGTQLSGISELDLSGQSLSSLQAGDFAGLTGLTQLDLKSNRLRELPLDLFAGLTALERLELDSNELSFLPDGVFSGLAAVQEVSLNDNQLGKLPTGAFSGLTSLTGLLLHNNRLNSLQDGVFAGLNGLQRLRLDGNAIDPLPLTVSLEKVGDSQVKAVAATGAPFSLTLPVSVSSSGEITDGATAMTIGLGAEESTPLGITRVAGTIEAVTIDIGTLPDLPADHQGYFLTKEDTLPREIVPTVAHKDAALTDLLLSDGTLDPPFMTDGTRYTASVENDVLSVTVTPETRQPGATVVFLDSAGGVLVDADQNTHGHQAILDVGENEIKVRATSEDGAETRTYTLTFTRRRPPEGGVEVCERTAQIQDAILAALPDVTACADVTSAHLLGITALELFGKDISSLRPNDFDNLTELISLNLYGNKLRELPAEIFSGLGALEELRLGGNDLSALPAGIFSGLKGLRVLGLYDNELTRLPARVFSGLVVLEDLRLGGNGLSALPAGVFSDLTALEELGLYGNKLSSLRADTFSNLSALEELTLSNNKLDSLRAKVFANLGALEKLTLGNNELSSLPAGIFSGLGALSELSLKGNEVNPLPLTVSLEKVGSSGFKAVAPAGAPFALGLPVSVSSAGELAGGVSRVTIPAGALESAEVEVTRVSGATAAVTVDLGTLPGLPANHDGYAFEESGTLPVEILPPGTPPDATLSGLSLSDGTLDPVFASGTTSYTASVENAVSSVTVTPAKGDTNATLEYLDSDDSTLADADTGTEGHQVDLEVGENTFKVKVTAEDTTTTQTYVIVVTREEVVRNAPVIVTTSPIAVAENQTEVATLEATDADGDEITWSTSGGADEDNFDLTSAGVLTFVSGRDFEAPGDDDRNNEYVVEVSASDQITDATTLTLIVEVTDVEEDDPTIRDARLSRLELSDGSLSPVFASNTTSYTVKVVSGVSSITVTPTASHAGASVRFLDASDQVKEDDDTGADGHQVNLDAGENTFKVEVKSSDGTVTQSYTVLVTRNRLPAVTSTSPLSVEENETAVTTLAATDADGDAIRWSAKAVEDAAEFDVNANGSIVFTTAPDYENPADSGGNNEYVLIVLASDGTETVEWTLTVNVTDVHEPSTDSTLSGLSLSDATLDPVFASGTTRYTASVENAVSSVTVTPAASDANAAVAYLDSSDSPLADADTPTAGHQVALEVGENTFKVKVTAEDETTTTTYTLAVTRQSPAQSSTDVCERTAGIRDAIVAAVSGVSACADLTAAHLSAITSLDMTGDNISSLQSGDFAGLTALETIGLYDNDLTRLPADIFSGLSTLENLHLGGNGLSVLPSGVFSDLAALEILGLYENQLTRLPAGIFSGLSALEELRLGDNELSALPSGVFSDLTALEELGLYGNKLSSLRADTFSNLSALKELTLSNNKLASLRAKVFANLGALEKLTLGNNDLSSLPAGIFSGLGALTELSLGGNTVDPLLLTVSLEKVGSSGFKAVAPAGAPFALELPVSVSSAGELAGGVSRVTIPAGALESAEVEVTRVSGATDAVTVDLGTLPDLPANHDGYAFEEGGTLPVEILPPRTPPDATLSGLSLSDGTLDPVFASATTSYTASVENAVSSVTVTPAKGDTNATLEYLDSDDSTLADADTGTEGHQVDLEVGENTFKVKVTAEDTTTTRTYTIVVTREEVVRNAPVIVTTSPISAAENQTAVATLEATDADGDDIVWTTDGGADEALFDLTSAGVLSFLTAPDFEAPSDANGDNEYVVVVEASDEITDATTLTLTIAVSDVSETPAQSDDATLSGLSLSDGTLDPVFASATTSYTASVENAVSSITVTPAKGDTNATLAYLDADDGTLADADTGADGHQVDLEVGDTTFKVKVTAEDTTTTQTYAIVVTRESAVEVAGGVCERTAQVRDAIVAAVSGVDACKGVSEAHLLAITSLGLTSNAISSLQSGDFAGLTSLETLGLYDNELTSLPADIFSGLSALKNLHLGANSLSELPAGIFSDLTALEVLGLFDNELIRLRARVFSGLSALRDLRIGSNALTTLPSRIFSGLTKLEVLGLYGNDLGNFRADTFSNLRALEELTLSNNKLDRLRARLFADLEALERLTLGNNKFDSLRADTFNNLGALQELTLNDNRLSSLPAGIFSNLTALDSLDLSGNTVDPMPLTVSLKTVGSDQFKAVAPAGAPFSLDLPVTVSSGGEIDGDADSVTILTGSVESGAVAVTRVAGATAAVTVNIGTLPSLPTNHTGYALEKDDSLPLTVLSAQSSGSTAGEIADASGADVNGNGRIEADDAMIIYHAYESAGRVGDGETGGSPAARQMLLSGLADAPGASDAELREMLRKANTWRAAGVGAGGDINGDGLIDGADALAMYYAFEFEDLVGDGEIGGSARFRRSLMGELSGKPNPGDADLKTLLRNAHALGRKASPLGRRASPPSTSTSP